MRELVKIIWSNKLLVAIAISFFIVGAMYWIPDRWVDKGWDARLRIAGGLLQLLGIWEVLKSLTGKRTLFGLVSIRNQQASFVRRLKAFFHLGVGGSADISAVLPSVQGSAAAMAGSSSMIAIPLVSDHERIEALEQKQIVIGTRIDGLAGKLIEETAKLTSAMYADRETRDSQHRQLEDKVKKAVVGDIDLDLAGVIWLLFGTALATFAPEIARLW